MLHSSIPHNSTETDETTISFLSHNKANLLRKSSQHPVNPQQYPITIEPLSSVVVVVVVVRLHYTSFPAQILATILHVFPHFRNRAAHNYNMRHIGTIIRLSYSIPPIQMKILSAESYSNFYCNYWVNTNHFSIPQATNNISLVCTSSAFPFRNFEFESQI